MARQCVAWARRRRGRNKTTLLVSRQQAKAQPSSRPAVVRAPDSPQRPMPFPGKRKMQNLPGEPTVRAHGESPRGEPTPGPPWTGRSGSKQAPAPSPRLPPAHPTATQGQLWGRFWALKKHSGSDFQSAGCTLNTTPRYSVPGCSSAGGTRSRRCPDPEGRPLTSLAPAGWEGHPAEEQRLSGSAGSSLAHSLVRECRCGAPEAAGERGAAPRGRLGGSKSISPIRAFVSETG